MKKAFGIDHGNGNVKMRSSVLKETIASVYARKEDLGESLGKKTLSLDEYTIDGETYVWGADINKVKNTKSSYGQQNRYTSDNYKILSKITMARMVAKQKVKATDEIIIVTGVPSHEIGTEREEEIRKVYLGEHTVLVGIKKYIWNVTTVIIKPQPVGSVMCEYLDEEGFVANEEYENMVVGVIDIGAGTTDLDVINGLRREKNSSSARYGIQDVYNPIIRKIEKHYQGNITTKDIEECFEYGFFNKSMRIGQIDFMEVKEKAIQDVYNHIYSHITKAWKNFDEFDQILVVGGGANVFGQKLEESIGRISIVEDCQFSNVEGFYRLAQIAISDEE